ncbi:MAG: extracellular solute-binding protein [Anaerolineae bacterium]
MDSRCSLSRRKFLGMTAMGVTGLLAGCQPQVVEKVVKETVPVKETVLVQETVAPASLEDLLPPQDKLGSPDHPKGWKTILPDPPPGTPYKPPITITTSKRVNVTTKYCGNDTMEDNPWFRMIYNLFGVQYKVAWTWSDAPWEKYNVAAASGDLPDFMETVPLANFVKMVEAGQVEDITDAYERFASPRWQAIWREYGDQPWATTKINGRIYGLPPVMDLAHSESILWYREDWLEKTGLPVPTTFDQVREVALAFAKGDFGAGAKGTTIGLASNTGYYHTWFGDLACIWGGFGYIPDQWQPEGDDLMYGAIRPEVKEALALLRQWYQDGVFAKDWYTKGPANTLQDIAANLCGLHFTPAWGAWPDSVKNDPSARWKYTGIPVGPKGFKRRYGESPFLPGPFCYRKGVEVEKIQASLAVADWWDQLWHDPWRRFHGWEGCNYEWDGDVVKEGGAGFLVFQDWTPGPIGTPGGTMVDPKALANQARYELGWAEIEPDKRDAWQNLVLEDPTGCLTLRRKSLLYIVETSGEAVLTKFMGLPTPTQLEKGGDLSKLENETFINIIIGQQPLSDWDRFVEQWKSMGGDQWTREVNEWWHARA